MTDQFLRRLDVEYRSGKETLLLAIGFNMFGDMRFVLGDTLNQFATCRKNIPDVTLVLSRGCLIIRGSGGSKIGGSLLN